MGNVAKCASYVRNMKEFRNHKMTNLVSALDSLAHCGLPWADMNWFEAICARYRS